MSEYYDEEDDVKVQRWNINTHAFFGGVVSLSGNFYQYSGRFQFIINLPYKHKALLEMLRSELGDCGSLQHFKLGKDKGKKTYLRLTIQAHQDLDQVVIPYFQNVIFGSKKTVFEEWCKAFHLHINGKMLKVTRKGSRYHQYRNPQDSPSLNKHPFMGQLPGDY